MRENQKDEDSCTYAVLDAILERLWSAKEPISAIMAGRFERDTVVRVERMLKHIAEYKRRQARRCEGDVEEFWPRPRLSDHQPLPRFPGTAIAGRLMPR